MSDTLFRPEAIEAQRERLAGTVIAAVPPSARLYTGVVAAVMLAIVLLLTFGSYATSAPIKGVVAYDTGVARIYPRSPAETRRVLVNLGDLVTAGQPLVELRLAEGEGGLSTQIAQMTAQIGEIDRQIGIAGSLQSTDSAAFVAQRAGLIETAASLERQQAIARQQASLAEAAVGRSQRLEAEGAGTRRQVDVARAELLARRAEIESLGERLITTRSTIADIGFKLGQGSLASGRTRSELVAQRAALINQRDNLQRADSITLTAPVAGRVSDIATEPGRFTAVDTSLMTIVPEGGQMEVWFYANSQAVGFAKVGQRVRLRFDAFPYQKYGSGRGTVTDISRVAIDPRTIDPALGITEPTFRVRVAIDAIGMGAADASRVRPGMTVSGDVVTERRPLWALLLGPIRESVVR